MMWAWALVAGAWAAEDCARPLKGKPGSRQVAFVVGVSDYAADAPVYDLPGAAADALRVRDLLVDDFGFPKGNVCTLTDERATMDGVRSAWTSHLRRLAPGDSLVVYFAGHGSQTGEAGSATYVLHDSRTEGVSDLTHAELESLLGTAYQKTRDLSVWIDASHEAGPHDGTLEADLLARWVPPTEVPEWSGRQAPPMPEAVFLHGAARGMPALERDGAGVFTTALIQALRTRRGATWHQIAHDVARWVAAMHSWQQPSSEGAVDRSVFRGRGAQASTPWSVTAVKGAEIRLQGPPMMGWSPGALVAVVDGVRAKAQVRIDGVAAGTAVGTVVGGQASRVEQGDPVLLEAPGEDLTAIAVRIDPEVRLGAQIQQAILADAVLGQTVHVVDGAADYSLRAGPQGTIDIVGADGVRRNRLPGLAANDAVGMAQTLGLYARQASLLALSGEVPEAYPQDMFDLRILPATSQSPGCARTPYTPAERALPFVQVPMCNSVQLEVTLRETPTQPLYLGVLYLAGNGSIHVWPRGKDVVLREAGDQFTQVLGWVTPPLFTPDRLLVFGTHQAVQWRQLEELVLSDVLVRTRSFDLDFWVSAVTGAKTRSTWAREAEAVPAWTASMVSLEIVADPARWSEVERDTTAICGMLRKKRCGEAGE